MKTTIIIIGFLILAIFGGIKSCQLKNYIREKTELETKFALAQKEKAELQKQLKEKQAQNNVLIGQKQDLEQKLANTIAETNNQIEAFKNKIKDLSLIPADTIYQDVFSKWPAFDQVLKFRFAENQVRGMYLNILERDHFEGLYTSTTSSLITCSELNVKNDQIIGNLSDQNVNLKKQVIISDQQIVNLQENVKITESQLNKQKRRTFIYKLTTVAAAGAFIFK